MPVVRKPVLEPSKGLENLLARLTKGHKWLIQAWAALNAMPNQGLRTPQEARFLEGLDRWDGLDKMLREVYPLYTYCVCGRFERCPEASPIRCRGCAGSQAEKDFVEL